MAGAFDHGAGRGHRCVSALVMWHGLAVGSSGQRGKAAISATQAVAAAVLRLWTAAQQRHKSVELKVLERLQRHSLMRVWFCRLQRRTVAAGPWMASELRAMRLNAAGRDSYLVWARAEVW